MSAIVAWVQTTSEVYFAIRRQHSEDLRVHGTITRIDEWESETRLMTEWGLKDADYPLIKIDQRGAEVSYFIAAIVKGDES